MKSLLASLFSNTQQPEPYAWISALEGLDDAVVLETVTQQLSNLMLTEGEDKRQLYKTTMLADQQSRHSALRYAKQFIDYDNLREDLRTQMFDSAYFYHRQIYNCYRELLQNYEDSDLPPFPDTQLPMVLGRALHAGIEMTMWRHFNQLPAANFTWQELHGLYSLVEAHGYADFAIHLYENEPEFAFESRYIVACMLGSLDHTSITKQQMHIASQLVNQWGGTLRLYTNLHPKKHLFYVDLASNHPARRIRQLGDSRNYRYWEADVISARLDLAIHQLEHDEEEKLPELKPFLHFTYLLDVMKTLRNAWTRHEYQRQRRTEKREKVTRSATVYIGYDKIVEQFGALFHHGAVSEHALEDKLMRKSAIKHAPNVLFQDSMQTRWVVTDESVSGFGMTLPQQSGSNLKLGSLLGLVLDGHKESIILATVKSIKSKPNQQRHIGLKIMARKAILSEVRILHKNSESQAETTAGTSFPALYLPLEDGLSIWPAVIMPRISFLENKEYEFTQLDQKVTARLGKPVETKEDWVKVNWPD